MIGTTVTSSATARPRSPRARAAVLALVVALVGGLTIVGALPARAAITAAFTQVFSANTSGGIQIRGNTLMTCQATATSCASGQSTLNVNNNSFAMTYVDADSDVSTFDSSNSTVNVPSGASVLFAALTWGGNTSAGTVVNSVAYGSGTPVGAPTPASAGQVKLKVPGTSTYQTTSSSRTSFLSGSAGAYQGYANVTALVRAAGNGVYTVANVQTGTGGNAYGGWGLTIAYSNPTDPPRNLTIFSGFGSVASGDVVDIPVSGFQTPPNGSVTTTLGAISYEGDAASTGDQMQLGNTTSGLQNVTDALHPAANSFTSVISDLGVDSSTRTPNYKNQLGYDAATLNVNGFLANNTTSAVIRLTSAASGGETYYPGVVTFATDLYSPNLTATKSVALVQKASGNSQSGVPEPGDTLRYTIGATNAGLDDAVNTVLTDAVPTGSTYVAGSLTAAGSPLTDAGADDVGSYAAGTVRVDLGTGATASAGGTVSANTSAATVTFDATVNSNAADGTALVNTAQYAYAGNQTGLPLTSSSNTVTSTVVRHHSALSITKTADTALVQKGAGTHVTYTLTTQNAGPYDDPTVTVTDTLATGASLVSATPSAGSCTNPTGQVVCALGALANGTAATVTVVVTLDAATDPATDTATVAGANVDAAPADNSASVSTRVNTAPVAVDDSATTSGGVAVVAVLGNDSDPDGDPLTVTTGSVVPAKGGVVVNSDKTVTYTANAGAVGLDTFTYVVSDGRGGSATGTVTVTIPDAPPQAVADADTTTRNTPVTIPVLANDTDPNIPGSGQTLSVSAVTQPAGSKGTVTTDGATVTFTPSGTFHRGTATFTYTVSDGAGGTAAGTVTVTIPSVAPVAADDTASTPYLTAVTVDVLANDSDDNGDPLTVTAVTGAQHGTATITGTGAATKILYTPATTWSGTDVLTYTISDGTLTATAHLTIATADAPPTAGNYTQPVPGGTPTTLDAAAHATDPNGDPLTVTAAGPATHGTVTLDSNGNIIYTPDPAYAGPDTLTYTVSDGHGATATATITLTIANQPPTAGNDMTLVPLNGHAVIPVLTNDTDPNSDPLTVSAVTLPAHGTAVANSDGTITYTPVPGFLGSDAFGYTVSDGHGGTDSATVTVTVANQPPSAADDTATASGLAGSPITIPVLANDSDPNGDPLSIVSVSTPAHGTATISGADLVYTPDATYAGPDPFTYTISDGRGGLSSAAVLVTVQNRDPVANADAFTATTGVPTAVAVLANDTDPDGEALAVLSVDPTSAHGGTIALGPGTEVTYTSATHFVGTDTFSYVVTDPRGGTATGLVTMTIPHDPPVAVDDTASTPYLTAVTVDVLANDSDDNGDPLTVTAVTGAQHGTATITGTGAATKILYTPATTWSGTDVLTYTISDGTLTATAHLTIATADAPPTAGNYTQPVPGGTPTTLDAAAHATDPNGDPLTVTAAGPATHGTVTLDSNGNIIYTPDPAYAGPDTLTYTVSDGRGGTATATITLTVANQPPTAGNDTATASGLAGSLITIPVLANDSDPNGDPLSIVSVSTPAHGTATISGTDVVYTPLATYAGPDSFSYTISDGRGGLSTANVLVNVRDRAPIAGPDAFTASTGMPIALDVLASDSDPDGETLAVLSVDPTSTHGAVVTLGPGSEVTYTSATGFVGTDTFSYVVTDPRGATATGVVTMTVSNANPVAPDLAATAEPSTATFIDLRSGASDPDGQPLSVASVGAAAHGTVSVSGSGIATYTPANGFVGTDTFSYTIADGEGGTGTGTVTVTVIPGPHVVADEVTTVQGVAATFAPLANDTPGVGSGTTLDPTSVAFLDPTDPTIPTRHLTVAGVGSYEASVEGVVTFTPDLFYAGVSTVTYYVSDQNGNRGSALISVTVGAVVPVAVDDTATAAPGSIVTVDVLDNDHAGDLRVPLDPTTVRLIIPGSGLVVTAVAVAGQGTYLAASDGSIRFTPVGGFAGDSTIGYQVLDRNGTPARATLAVHEPATAAAAPDSASTTGSPVTIDVLSNDTPAAGTHWMASTLCLLDPSTGICGPTVTMTGIGTMTVLGDGRVRFTPVPGFTGTAYLSYRVTDSAGHVAQSTFTVRGSHAPTPAPTGVSPPPEADVALPYTGLPIVSLLTLGLGLFLAGSAVRLAAPRRRRGLARRRRR